MDYEKLIAFRNSKNTFCRRLGIRVTEIGPGRAVVVKTMGPEDLNPLNLPHGGVYFSMADTACGSAVVSHGHAAVTVDAGYHFLRSAKSGDTVTATAREVKAGKTLSVCDVELRDQDGVLLGTGTFTFFILEELLDL
ncbi:PaaI family thioesterase [uncultured Oscillibacter sp.]|uniref:PaaI family thioesterase n=1 Tax=uncultured Oscillibacter sp. TaxID=876091 RepID=UPI0025F1B3F8|nr:PaaI family thioesterase [uncultured Oscillibacter sp.]